MRVIQNKIVVEIDPSRPVQEVCDVIAAVVSFHPGKESELLTGLMQAIEGRLQEIVANNQEQTPE